MTGDVSRPCAELLLEIYHRLRGRFGHRNWWPGDTPFEIIVGAILTQNTNWKNVEKAISNLKRRRALDFEGMLRLPTERLAELVRPAGYFNQKAARLKITIEWLSHRTDGDLSRLEQVDTGELRSELLALKGIGPETADSILLYAFQRPVFVIDAYTRRSSARMGIAGEKSTYGELQDLFERNLPTDVALFNDFHAQFVELGKHHCRKHPRCGGCPLNGICARYAEVGADDDRDRNRI